MMSNEMRVTSENPDIASLRTALESLVYKMNAAVTQRLAVIGQLHRDQEMSAVNLLHYLALRNEDIRSLQDKLHILGLSSLASSESHVLRQVQAILQRLGKRISPEDISPCDYYRGRNLIDSRSKKLFGAKKDAAIKHLMVTFATGFADNFQLIKKLLEAGMNVARINCAHDSQEVWHKMVSLVHSASEETGIPCKIYMDIAGPKIRTSLLGREKSNERVRVSEEQEITLAEKDTDYDPGNVVIGCDEPGIVRLLKTGERVVFDDGIIEARVMSNQDGVAALKIIRVSPREPEIRAGKGINFPDSDITLNALTDDDRSVLPFMCEHADLIGYSFVSRASDLKDLQQELLKFKKRPGIILKIETTGAVKNFPSLLMEGMKEQVFGVMIARGDLAVEIGFERMSEIQEEILWICEAAHVPVIWATQVLETLNKSGIATRSEITDAFYAAQAECVMLNKGDYIIKALKTLTDILRRSGGHHVKKRFTFRPMQIASDYLSSAVSV